jgi:hypothetical protein
LFVTDWNEDGGPDVALGMATPQGLRMLRGDACTTFSRFITLVPPAPGAPAAAAPAAGSRPAHPSVAAAAWTVGDEQVLTWTKSADVFAVDLLASRNGGATWEVLARRVPGTSFTWTVTGPATTTLLLRARDAGLGGASSTTVTPVTVTGGTTGVNGGDPVAASFSSAWPNPARGSVRFELGLPGDRMVDVAAFDISGRQVATLAHGVMGAGRHSLLWNAAGGGLPAGIYLVRARWEGYEAVRRVVRVP